MDTVLIKMPEEIVREAAIPYDGVRDAQGVVLAIEGINLIASAVTLVTLRQYAPALASAIRRWRMHQRSAPVVLTVKGNGIDLRIELPPNVSVQDILGGLDTLLDGD